ncbi:dethiobiotin synthase [Bradyrhizobium canariense]|uniref:ATP-dependent dethiobiotin synthetase BioD n=1 Tax=Bradyrhizobium canariense TaxID=255045 RepID=A0A1H1XVP4_9BRAD|nr:dethiobiotin synthase [Bradyrhizobium canariense]SDT13368.1 dethiobiotin synthetase [Bradyrhizobium canariense]
MSARIIVTGTDTGIGKTVFAAGLAGALDGVYWKPIQAGVEEETDRATVLRLSGLSPERVLAEVHRLRTPASPHLAAERDGIVIDPDGLALPDTDRPLVVEGAGGLLVPLTRNVTYIDVMARWNVPVVLCARTSLGTINHSLLSVEALRARSIAIAGIAFIGDENPESERIITDLGNVRHLGRLPYLDPLTGPSLRVAFARHFRTEDFLQEMA